MKVITYAALKDYFDKELQVEEPISNVQQLQQFLTVRNPAAIDILKACRFAVKDNFVSSDFMLESTDEIHVIPPSSGG